MADIKADLEYDSHGGFFGIRPSTEGRLFFLAEPLPGDRQRCWVFGPNLGGAAGQIISGNFMEGTAFREACRKLGLVVEETEDYMEIPLSCGIDPEEYELCRTDLPSPRELARMIERELELAQRAA